MAGAGACPNRAALDGARWPRHHAAVDGADALLGLLLGAGLGLVFSSIGAGGGTLAVPVMLLVFHQPLAPATGSALAVVFGTALVSAVFHWRRGNVDARLAVGFGAAAMAFAPLGGLLHRYTPDRVTLGLFCAVLALVAVRMWRTVDGAGPTRGHFAWPKLVALGATTGVMTGLLGIGGGFVVVPALTTLLGVPMRIAVGTSTAVVCAASFSGALTYAASGALAWPLLLTVGSGALLRAALGVPLSHRLPELLLRRAFAVIALLVCLRMLGEVALAAR
jgi:uncharacterized membrane protein YfcA